MSSTHHIILLAHGSSDKRWCETFEKLAEPTLNSIENATIAYMELAEPSMETIVAQARASGASQFTVVPLFLAAGRHLRKDVPAMIKEIEQEHNVSMRLADPIGYNPQLGLAIRDVVQEELAKTAN
ncbi:MAG: cobalamin biosynthesis protein CbiX [Gammaproteobacteria bacterium]|uniref:Sirohydrochlorin cobaltochelatase n=1 Tax=Marinobacter litoralis TaxID=187981 RepID=A0A3M2R9P8_9GAMM|nr:CbiX/SirB N-terminal domain-containing protein [Marinobacter litoralis]MBR9869582.1 cobalamin biosynthesis protein CbiX [Gammaproteobacteria bacterium]RMJ01987.1 sirohydrochlorin cobaltochelatase [Marinobacter litoralis]